MAEGTSRPKSRKGLWIGLIGAVVACVLIWTQRARIAFDPRQFLVEVRSVSWVRVLAAILITYGCFFLRAIRWRVLLTGVKRVSVLSLYEAQLVGFGSVALFGRAADLVRPYLIARKSATPVATQMAIYSIERALDLGAAAVIFSVTVLFVPRGMAHHAVIVRAGLLSLAGTVFLFTVGLTVRFAGEWLAGLARGLMLAFMPRLADTIAGNIRDLQRGFSTITSLREFSAAACLSVVMWLGIALGYVESAHAFRASAALVGLTFPQTMFLMAAGIGGSLLQIPILGWFTQIGVLAAALHGFFGVPLETASACGAVLLITTSLCIIPAGVVLAHRQGIGMRLLTQEAPTKE